MITGSLSTPEATARREYGRVLRKCNEATSDAASYRESARAAFARHDVANGIKYDTIAREYQEKADRYKRLLTPATPARSASRGSTTRAAGTTPGVEYRAEQFMAQARAVRLGRPMARNASELRMNMEHERELLAAARDVYAGRPASVAVRTAVRARR